ncbi:TetR/AcrR family transcriptional regulator [Fuchsiella alkaliacetigena]|uniref:TetR/AcrR family transcriptional regulator n=1 Tax=Fuchsiella alkaliacetigena TaxID=957042 RepID=UPI00200A388F|nr:TetR/AcrR family transcriptional regulator [Fuchsiella alkaliacetigena]MCK8823592.1 TetR/AcrR family transcriptional regulator [Fuchsiella alkaliacetigena]
MEEETSKKELVMQAALELFSEQGYHETSVSEIAQRAEVAKGTVYWYFESKEQLFQEIMLSGLDNLYNRIAEQVTTVGGAVEKLEIVVELFLDFFEQNQELARMYNESTNTVSQRFKEQMHLIRENYLDLISQIISNGIEEGSFRADLKTEPMAQILLGMISAFNPICQSDELILASKAEHILEIFLRGIAE